MTSVKSMLLSSVEPQRLREFYRAVFAPSQEAEVEHYGVLTFEDFHLMIDHRAEIGANNAEPTRMFLNFEVDDARETARRCREHHAPWISELEDRDGSLFATVQDPDGNYVQFLQLHPAHREMSS